MRIYLDNCCFNRPFDDQTQLRIMLESEAKLKIQENISLGYYSLVWSYILDYENSKNPFKERRKQIERWRKYSGIDITENEEIIGFAQRISLKGVKKMDSLHLACAIEAEAKYFLTTDDKLIKRGSDIEDIQVIDPISFVKEMLL